MNDQAEFAAVINFVDANQSDSLLMGLSSKGAVVATLDGTVIHNQATLLEEIGVKLFGGKKLLNWAQLEDLLRLTILRANGGEYALVWTNANTMLEGGLRDLIVAADVFFRAARDARQHGRGFRVFLLGSGPNFQADKGPGADSV